MFFLVPPMNVKSPETRQKI